MFSWKKSGEFEPNNETKEILDQWLSLLPSTPAILIELAAGQGIESKYLASLGNMVTAYDADRELVQSAVFKVKQADVFNLSFRSGEIDGFLIKDAYKFFPTHARIGLLSNIYRGLKHGGSLLVMSEWSDTRAVVGLKNSIPIDILLSDFSSERDWENQIRTELKSGGEEIARFYDVDENQLRLEGKSVGFSVITQIYDYGSAYAQKNRWRVNKHFVSTFTKT